jgi:hypothetical protein
MDLGHIISGASTTSSNKLCVQSFANGYTLSQENNLSGKGLPISFPPDVISVEKPKIIHESVSYKGKVFSALNYHAMWTYLITRWR